MGLSNFVEELRWRGILKEASEGTEAFLLKGPTSGYVGIDPTADSLHVGHLVSVMLLKHLQASGHRPVVVVGGATGLIGDPSQKATERQLLSLADVERNLAGLRSQLERLLDFDGPQGAVLVNNYDWIGGYSFLAFVRDIGKHITVNTMLTRDSVKQRLERAGEGGMDGLSFTEFTYQLIQGADFLHLRRSHGVYLQMGGSDQWGNMITGAHLVHSIDQAKVYCLTSHLLLRSDGTKFGKTAEGANVWLDAARTSPYAFYQFWYNLSDEMASRCIRIFTMLTRAEIEGLEIEHGKAPHLRALQKRLGALVTEMVHGREETQKAIAHSAILFGTGTVSELQELPVEAYLAGLEGVPRYECSLSLLDEAVPLRALLTEHCPIFASKGEFRRLVEGGGLSINRQRVDNIEATVSTGDLLHGTLLVQKGKKGFHAILFA